MPVPTCELGSQAGGLAHFGAAAVFRPVPAGSVIVTDVGCAVGLVILKVALVLYLGWFGENASEYVAPTE
jgi:hypothetical protein